MQSSDHEGEVDGDEWKGTYIMNAPRTFDFSRNWKRRVAPLLDDQDVVKALTFGLKLYDKTYHEGDPPWQCGRGPLNGQIARQGCLSWYQPWGRCHYIAPFCWALGKRLFPEREWGFITSDCHTVVIGWADKWEEPEWVMDILLFKEKTAEESLVFAKAHGWKFYRSLARYATSFFTDPEHAFEVFHHLDVPWQRVPNSLQGAEVESTRCPVSLGDGGVA